MSEDPWAREQAAANQQTSGNTGTGAATSQAAAQAEQAAAPHVQPVTEPIVTALGTWQESAPGYGASEVSYPPQQYVWDQGATSGAPSGGGYGLGGAISQAQASGRIERMVLMQLEQSPPIVQKGFMVVEQRTGVPRSQLGLGLAFFFALYMIFGYFAQLLCNFVGFAIPAYASMRAIESTKKDDDTKWLTYWVVFACFSVVDFFADNILRYFPFYWLAKIIFLVYCFAPIEPNGSHQIYYKFIRPFFLRNEGSINKMASEAGAGLKSALQQAASAAAAAKNQ